MNIKFILISFLFCFSLGQNPLGESIDGVLAVVGENIVTQSDFFEQLKSATNLEVSDLIKLPINSVTPRTNELVKMGVLIIMGRRKCSISGNTAIVWGKK